MVRRGPSWPADLIAEARMLYEVRGLGPTDIAANLDARKKDFGVASGPPVPTVKTWTRGLTRGDGGRWDPWSEADETLRRRIAAVAAWKALASRPPASPWLTKPEAQWVGRIVTLLPDDSPETLYRLARVAIEHAEDTERLQAFELELMVWSAEPGGGLDTPGRRVIDLERHLGRSAVMGARNHRWRQALAKLAAEYGDWRAWREDATKAGVYSDDWTLRQLKAWHDEQEAER
jgi:hypothetical protein